MPNYSIALGAKTPQFDLGNTLAQVNQFRSQQQAMRNNALKERMAEAQLSQLRQEQEAAQQKQSALSSYRQAQMGGEEGAINQLAGYPDIQSKVLDVRSKMGEQERQAFDQRLLRNSRRAQYVAGFQGEERMGAWQQQLDDALRSGDISEEQYQQYSQSPPNDLLLQNVMSQAAPIEKIYESEIAPTTKQRELESAGVEPGTPEYRGAITGIVPKFEKVGNRLFKIGTDNTVTDVTPEGVDGEFPIFETPKDRIQYEQKLRKEHGRISSTFQDVRDAQSRVEASAKDPSAAGDLAMIFNYMKILDPASVVRESEFATAASAGTYGDRIQGLVNQVLNGQRLAASQRQDFLNRARTLYRAQERQYGKVTGQYRTIAERAGLDPEDVILDYSPAEGNIPEPGAGDDQGGPDTPEDPALFPGNRQQQTTAEPAPLYQPELPQEAVDMLRNDPSPEARAEFDEVFGEGAAARVLGDEGQGAINPPAGVSIAR